MGVNRHICRRLGLERSMVSFTVDDTCIGDNDTMVTLGLIFNYMTVTFLRDAVGDEVEHNFCQSDKAIRTLDMELEDLVFGTPENFIGSCVQILGLVSRSELNGSYGRIEKYNAAKQRF